MARHPYPPLMKKPHIVVVGSGFGGLHVAKSLLLLLKKGLIDVTIINRTNYFLFTPLLHEVATGGLSAGSIAESLREIFFGTDVRILLGNVDSIDSSAQIVHFDKHQIHYDFLVLATGADTNFYDIPGAQEFCFSLKNLSEALRIRSSVINSFERAILSPDMDEMQKLLSFVVVGGGATGVELAAELMELVEMLERRYFHRAYDFFRHHHASVTLVNSGQELLSVFSPFLRKTAEQRLRDQGVIVHKGSRVTEVSADHIGLANGVQIFSRMIVWTAGVKPVTPDFSGIVPVFSGGKICVDPFLRAQGFSNIFVLGDIAFCGRGDCVKPVPMFAQAAFSQSKTVSRNIIASLSGKSLEEFEYHSQGNLISLGQWYAAGDLGFLKFCGRIAWFVWRTIYLFKFASWKKRVRIVFEWTLNIFHPRDITNFS